MTNPAPDLTDEPSFYLDKSDPTSWKALNALTLAVRKATDDAGLPRAVVELASVRISQINGCAYCLDLHGRLAVEAGVPERKLHVLPAWREAGLFTVLERAALDVAEAVTLLPDDEERLNTLAKARAELGDARFSALAWAAVTMNAFNRVSIVSRHKVQP
ncbi:Alkylhydroperoxidase AhpD family core domain protein [Sinomonas atrocyanea]|uniref:Alkylhydroperoxidase AhpD family core domain protein n=1 Tax=Sinomonas atrocyanea TaxID=37927 RepID=A0A127A645_9MICC|nr:carboxymuconolactone decarboxylase family protein [Sinomonas atrocyanea]AMM34401.1 Alkylhydroperoxidase AhpD family core domain protein [Sinomonas atrocyanea]GEB66365.1 alkyl hydroperoxide reductase AhpD [Sinomonas atrocyanea]GGG60807.1 alkyl hydroperoxide reductase AhpD [Sinomonas atrocyanea]